MWVQVHIAIGMAWCNKEEEESLELMIEKRRDVRVREVQDRKEVLKIREVQVKNHRA